jgi:hypothetical protein
LYAAFGCNFGTFGPNLFAAALKKILLSLVQLFGIFGAFFVFDFRIFGFVKTFLESD